MNQLVFLILYFCMSTPINSHFNVTFTHLPHNEGTVHVLLFNQPDGFPNTPSKAYRSFKVPISNGKADLSIKGLPVGIYAISTFHDHDGDGLFRTGPFGIPKDPYGFSNDVRGVFGPPAFEKAAFTLKEAPRKMSIRMRL
ncbi:DUF2141 domain-containing protein [Lunatimonas salinarum]|uniref:DUF2141 domain-containing protein n=1 Tax=Lunatimonas salinarum TaxID=1774590 RepID=UPI001AE0607E|nr:DUF2141 domain-containing protein [Lunatimonas salinarum]